MDKIEIIIDTYGCIKNRVDVDLYEKYIYAIKNNINKTITVIRESGNPSYGDEDYSNNCFIKRINGSSVDDKLMRNIIELCRKFIEQK